MIQIRFSRQQISFIRWRCRTARRRALLLSPPLAVLPSPVSDAAPWRHALPLPVSMPLVATVLHIGKFIVSEMGDPQLQGHPDIRY